jgi:tetratricopeptide (TPR) repeat protein
MESDSPSEINVIWDEARSHVYQGDYERAIEIYKYILIRYAEEKVAVEYASCYLGDIYITLDKPELAKPCIKKALGFNPQNPSYRYQLGFIYTKLEKWEKAIAEFKIAAEIEPNNAEYLRGLGWAMYNGQNEIKGLKYLSTAHDLEPRNINVINDLAVAYLGLSDFKAAIEFNNLALKINPGDKLAIKIREQINHFEKFRTKES